MKKTLTIIAPAYNEEAVIADFCQALIRILEPLKDKYDCNILVVIDKCPDKTFQIVRDPARSNPRIRALQMSSRFGHQSALLAGIDHSESDLLIMMDCDFQHPPELIPRLLGEHEKGADIVFTVKADYSSSWWRRISSRFGEWRRGAPPSRPLTVPPGGQTVIVSIQVEGKPLVEVRRGVGPPRDDQALLVERHHVDAIRGQADACSVGLAHATDKPSGPVDADETVTGVLRQGGDSFDPVIVKDHKMLMTEDEPVCSSACLVPVWYEALRGLDWQDPYLHLSTALTLFVLIPAICLQRAFWGAKPTAWMILDCLDVAFKPTGSFKDRGMTMAISPVPARLDAVLAQLGL